MAAKGKAAKAAGAAAAARQNPYIKRILEDAELRSNVRSAFESARGAYGRMSNGKGPTKALMEDKKLQKQLHETADALRGVSTSLRDGPKKRKRGGLGRKLLVVTIGTGLALALSEGLRQKVLDSLFGAEEEFDYTSTTTPASAPSEPVGSAS